MTKSLWPKLAPHLLSVQSFVFVLKLENSREDHGFLDCYIVSISIHVYPQDDVISKNSL